jgi:two-component system, LytTR family, response regulator LytT
VQILIVEDELLIAEMLKEMLLDLDHEIVAICKNYNEAIIALSINKKIDFCFIDINLKENKTGLDFAAILNKEYPLSFAFLTSYSDKTIIANALQYNPHAYLIKPFTEIDLYTTLELIKVKKQLLLKKTEPEIISIKDNYEIIKIAVKDILWLKADNIYTELKTTNKTYLIRTSITKFIDEHHLNCIARAHRTFAVNVNHVSAISGQYIIINNEKIPMSRKHKDEFLTKIK